jgi:hypothetical protein
MKIKYLLPIALLGILPTVSTACPQLTLTQMEGFVQQGRGARININGVPYQITSAFGSTRDFVTHTNPQEIINGMQGHSNSCIYGVTESRSEQGREVPGPEMYLQIQP